MVKPQSADESLDAEALLVALLEDVEQDHARIARRLHGELGGALAAARMAISTLRGGKVDAGVLVQVDAQLAAAQAVEQQVVEALRPGLLAHFGLGIALQAHAEAACRKAGVPIAISGARDLPALTPELAIVLYRFGEAALAGVLRQAPASLSLAFGGGGDAIHLRVAYARAAAPPGEDPALARTVRWIESRGGHCEVRAAGREGEFVAVLPRLPGG